MLLRLLSRSKTEKDFRENPLLGRHNSFFKIDLKTFRINLRYLILGASIAVSSVTAFADPVTHPVTRIDAQAAGSSFNEVVTLPVKLTEDKLKPTVAGLLGLVLVLVGRRSARKKLKTP
jgi:hypothetical protein